ncbi:hypothetical protein [Clostridium hydrogenum]|uniref:hypothetical protein n=1 Tax=Clostridium hydrogenum TaxID=2855764 RepID=UPI001F42FA91|nr:hypothetical protein [Clostridium hydrogenum]
MKKINITAYSIVAVFIISIIVYRYSSNQFVINKDKIVYVSYTHELDKNKMAEFDVTKYLNQKNIESMVNSLNNGKLRPDKNEVGKHTLEHMTMTILNDRSFDIYRQNGSKFTIMYQLNKESNSPNSIKQTTISSKTLENYFIKCNKLTKKLTPKLTWNIKK